MFIFFQFNFEFDLETDMFAEESISLLQVATTLNTHTIHTIYTQ